MTRRCWRIFLGTLVGLLMLASSASAECAWVLWAETFSYDAGAPPSSWKIWDSAKTLERCEEYGEIRATKLGTRGTDRGFSTLTRYICLPDTMDPRGRK
jgi:hypothetical protein